MIFEIIGATILSLEAIHDHLKQKVLAITPPFLITLGILSNIAKGLLLHNILLALPTLITSFFLWKKKYMAKADVEINFATAMLSGNPIIYFLLNNLLTSLDISKDLYILKEKKEKGYLPMILISYLLTKLVKFSIQII